MKIIYKILAVTLFPCMVIAMLGVGALGSGLMLLALDIAAYIAWPFLGIPPWKHSADLPLGFALPIYTGAFLHWHFAVKAGEDVLYPLD